ncbi:kallikrein 1-related peptidase b3-like [Amyelois transitella]|uniref:kallikrein 1-related peptidase b3-like n=1 Tax=Amyelois transitella TaxID=680683 RepID=UPI00298FC64D|nr:kallikrein 1-related peptidase b3-like [Amyelois transitella]
MTIIKIGGTRAALGDVPFQVAFKQSRNKRSSQYRTFCGGSIITPTKILTAAHCFESRQLCDLSKCKFWQREKAVSSHLIKNTYAVAGTLLNAEDRRQQNPSSQWKRLSRGVYPASYRFPRSDIAIITIRKPFTINSYVQPIPTAIRHVEYNMACQASGYGRLSHSDRDQQLSPYLYVANMHMIPTIYCNRMHGKNMYRFVCTSSRMPDTAKGDSGGPIVCKSTGDPNEKEKGVLVGIVSGHRVGVGSFFTRVSSFTKFIKAHSQATRISNTVKSAVILTIYAAFYLC